MNQNSIVLFDANAIIESHRVNCWNQLAEYFDLRTVAKVIEETQTGYQNREPETWIDEAEL